MLSAMSLNVRRYTAGDKAVVSLDVSKHANVLAQMAAPPSSQKPRREVCSRRE